ncbi:ankyrin repeat domain-containing protein [Kribbella sandramycini]|uniref:Ankyrin repeat domain-containing protein n=1 Tax=Kribbella sandramycini TaxID=60450 RepID=A0A7Y4KZR9_9ACTN|nr:ankyrin repeat domain-containing protein [Kribbella sandramycini]MBB6565394.1 ankyrin repeat protein [Kribbella sandramycini]NOL41663.1 ankyrin repeat domain-containing protein [Kribbella sandramycini]
MPTRNLPNDPHLDHLRKQAKRLLAEVRAGDRAATALADEFHPVTTLADAQLAIARSYGFPSWPRIVRHLELVGRYSRSPHRQSVGGPLETPEQRADEFLRLATLHYGQDDPARQQAARQLLDEVAASNIYTMVVAGDLDGVRQNLDQVREEGGPYQWEPLLYLTYNRLDAPNQVEIARLLLANGADPNAGYLWQGLPSPFTALTGVFGRGEGDQPTHPNRVELARLLLDAGADPNDSQTMYNCGPGSPPPYDEVHLELLLEYGLGRGDGGPWHDRMTAAHPTPQQLLEDELVFASSAGLVRRVELVLAQGIDPEGRGTEHPTFCGHRAYELAAVQGHTEIAALLRERGAAPLDDVHEVYAAAFRGETPAASAELAARAVARNPYLMHRAAEIGRTAALEPLSRLGFEVNHHANEAPIHRAALNGHLDTVRKLIELGADPELRDPMYGGNALSWAEHNHQDAVADYLRGLPQGTGRR